MTTSPSTEPPEVISAAISGWRAEWVRLTGLAAAVVTAVDAALLERSKGFFTGGFLAVDHLRSIPEALLFLGASILADGAIVGGLVGLGLWFARFVRLNRAARTVAILTFALAPLMIANFVSYQLHLYLGDAFDLGLMFDLTGRRPEEFFAVASSHIGAFLALIAVGAVGALGLVWAVNRYAPGARSSTRLRGRRVWLWPMGLFVAGLCSTALLRAGTDVMENGLRRKPSGKFLGAIAEYASDVDRDGYGVISRLKDPDPFNAAIFPYAVEIPGNGVDENGMGGDLPADAAAYQEPQGVASGWTHTPDVVMIVLESFRADVLGATFEGRTVSPVLNELAASGISADLAFSHNGYTAQSRHHLLAGSLAGLRQRTSLIDDFKANGYEVAYFSGQDESYGGPEFAVGFNRADVKYDARVEPNRRYSTFSTAGSLAVPENVVREKVDAFLASRRSTKPLLLYVNFHDTHFPYHHDGIEPIVSSAAIERGDIGPSRREELQATYLNTAANVDRAVGALLASARAALRSPAVIVTADHGESLYDEGFLGHGYALNDVQTRIPFIVSGLPLTLTEPFGQSELRDSLWAALSATPAAVTAPVLSRDESKRVFQYLGTIRRPRQIGFLTTHGRAIYDFPSRRVSLAGGDWQDPGGLTGDAQTEFLDLVHFWERMVLARAAQRPDR
jgi:hypothetical protein